MANWQGPTHTRRQDADSLPGARPRAAYFMLLPSGRYTIGVGNPNEEAAVAVADPIASAPNRFVLNDDLTLDHRALVLVGADLALL